MVYDPPDETETAECCVICNGSARYATWTCFLAGHAGLLFLVGAVCFFAYTLKDRISLLENKPASTVSGHATELSDHKGVKVQVGAHNSMAASVAQISASAHKASVRIRTADGSGSAVAIAPQILITARHVVEGSSPQVVIDIFDQYGSWRSINATVIALDDEADLALIRVSEDLPAVAVLGLDEARNAAPGDPLVCVGSTAGGTAWNSTAGYLSSKGAPEIDNTFWQMSVPIFFGNSGGAVYDPKTWKLVGISVAMNSFCSSFFVPAHTIKSFLDRMDRPGLPNVSVKAPAKNQTHVQSVCPGEPIKPFIRRKP